jgi:hypothetical protein
VSILLEITQIPKNKLKKLTLIIFLFSFSHLFSQLSLTSRNFIAYDKSVFSAEVKISVNGVFTNLNLENIVILEKNYSTPLIKIENLSDGWQKIFWIPNFTLITDSYSADILASKDVYAGKTPINTTNLNLPQLLVKYNKGGQQVGDVNFGFVEVGKSAVQQVDLIYGRPIKSSDGKNVPVKLDSITNNTPNFSYKWLGNTLSQDPPPCYLTGSFNSIVSIYFTPKENRLYYDVLTFHYHGGAKKHVKLFGNFYEVPPSQQLRIISPNGGEQFIPCQVVEIKWSGHVQSIPVLVQVSYDNGYYWKNIIELKDSVFLWSVPEEVSKNVKIRISQSLSNSDPIDLVQNVGVGNISYNTDASKLISEKAKGVLEEWDLINLISGKKYNFGNNIDYHISGLDYYDKDKIFISYNASNYAGNSIDTLSTIQNSKLSSFPFKSYKIGVTKLDKLNNNIFVTSAFGNVVEILDATTFKSKKILPFTNPVLSINLNPENNLAIFALINGDIEVMNLKDYSKIRTIKIDDSPLADNILIAPNGKYMAIACQPYQSTFTQIYLVLIETGEIITTFREIQTKAVGIAFNPTSTSFIFAGAAQPQILVYDIISKEIKLTFFNTTGILNNIAYSPAGNSLVTSAGSDKTLVYRTLTSPENDVSDSAFTIRYPYINTIPIVASDNLIFNDSTSTYTLRYCNKDSMELDISSASLAFGVNFNLKDGQFPVKLRPNECKDITINFNPKDTGNVVDTIRLINCNKQYNLLVSGKGIIRNLIPVQANFNFGEVCVGDTLIAQIDLVKNNDTKDIVVSPINIISNNNGKTSFIISPQIKDTLLKPGEVLKVRILVIPDSFGIRNQSIRIPYYYQNKYYSQTNLTVKGIGTVLGYSNLTLPFIPEIKTRVLTLTNPGVDRVQIDSANVYPKDNFRVLSSLPISIAPGGKADIEIEWFGNNSNVASLSLAATPCLVQKYIPLVFYSGSSIVSLNDIEVDPKNECEIIVKFNTQENYKYNGKRSFEAELSMNPRLFFPDKVTSDFGIGTLISRELANDRRIIKFRIDGDFNSTDSIVAKIHGFAGLAETDTTYMYITQNSTFWGKNVKTQYQGANFKLINLCGDRRVVDNSLLKSVSLAPNPANDRTTLTINTKENQKYEISIFDYLGNIIKKQSIECKIGDNSLDLDLKNIPIGIYSIKLTNGFENKTIKMYIER